ncbi:MAG: putative DNA binding domain-containing protein [Acidobacteria bacterium]|nr:putative DNA binding domain-containing protein [Acidobacteriota bacterium]
MADFFSGDLSKLTVQDFDDFLAIKQPEHLRPTESPRIDFKEPLPTDIGDAIAAMSNGNGGLVFVGVKSDKKKQNIPVGLVGVTLGTDARAQITDRILATVNPRPHFDIGFALLPGTNKHVAVIRVYEGSYPPYEYKQGSTVRTPMRIQDTNRQATVRELEELFKKRTAFGKSGSEVIRNLATADDLFCTYDNPSGEVRENDYTRIVAAPRVELRLRLDSRFERSFEKTVASSSPWDRQFSRNRRTGLYYQIERRSSGAHRIHRIWRVWANGALGFVGNLTRRGHPGEAVGDLAADLLFFCRVARQFFAAQGFWGTVVLEHELSCAGVNFLPLFPPPDGSGDYDRWDGINFPNSRHPYLQSRSICIEEVDQTGLEKPETLVAETLLYQLRQTWGAQINYDKLAEAVAALASNARDPNWGKSF